MIYNVEIFGTYNYYRPIGIMPFFGVRLGIVTYDGCLRTMAYKMVDEVHTLRVLNEKTVPHEFCEIALGCVETSVIRYSLIPTRNKFLRVDE